MAEYRAGRYAEAEAALLNAEGVSIRQRSSYQKSIQGTAQLYRAMALAKRGRREDARQLVSQVAETMNPLPADDRQLVVGGIDVNDLVLWLAYKEAEAQVR